MNDKPCLFTEDQIKEKIKEMYPHMDIKEVSYHSDKVVDNDWLKVDSSDEGLEEVIREQVEQ